MIAPGDRLNLSANRVFFGADHHTEKQSIYHSGWRYSPRINKEEKAPAQHFVQIRPCRSVLGNVDEEMSCLPKNKNDFLVLDGKIWEKGKLLPHYKARRLIQRAGSCGKAGPYRMSLTTRSPTNHKCLWVWQNPVMTVHWGRSKFKFLLSHVTAQS